MGPEGSTHPHVLLATLQPQFPGCPDSANLALSVRELAYAIPEIPGSIREVEPQILDDDTPVESPKIRDPNVDPINRATKKDP